ncbi:MAG: patatin-like phospholipase family protein [Oligoflexales bacterium]|nr:patatin-like phospholipase family protein [Oligoflexales bacterium]
MPHHKIIAIPGGGIKGVVSAVYLKRLVNKNHISLDELFCLSGTSTGVIITALLAKPQPFSVDDVVELYQELASKVFKRPNEWIPSWVSKLCSGASYDTKKLNEIASYYLGNTRVGDCPRKFVATIHSTDEQLGSYRAAAPLFITNFKTPFNQHIQDFKMSDVITGACAAPTYFYPHQFHHGGHWHKWTDGGVLDNASCIGAVSVATHQYNQDRVKLDDIAMLCLENGGHYYKDPADRKPAFWRVPRTGRLIINSLTQGGQTLSLKHMRYLLGSRFYDLNYTTPEDCDLDAYKEIPRLIEFAEQQKLRAVKAWLKGYFSDELKQ